jgi:hypothetical protein
MQMLLDAGADIDIRNSDVCIRFINWNIYLWFLFRMKLRMISQQDDQHIVSFYIF